MEEWRDIPDYEGIYQASNLGNIRTCEGKTTFTERHGVRHWKRRLLKQKLVADSRGRVDPRINLWKNGKEKSWLVSRLIGLTWCAGYSDGMTINHINGNPLDNCAKNLEWVTRSVNITKGFQDGHYDSFCKSIRLVKDGTIMSFRSMSEASKYLGRNAGYLFNCLKHNRAATNRNGDVFGILIEGVLPQ